jgi:argininosuccinate lyase
LAGKDDRIREDENITEELSTAFTAAAADVDDAAARGGVGFRAVHMSLASLASTPRSVSHLELPPNLFLSLLIEPTPCSSIMFA